MDSATAKQTLQGLRNTILGEVLGKQGQLDALDVAIKLLDEGYKADDVRIATELEKAMVELKVEDLSVNNI